jgi:hypothetical protein
MIPPEKPVGRKSCHLTGDRDTPSGSRRKFLQKARGVIFILEAGRSESLSLLRRRPAAVEESP